LLLCLIPQKAVSVLVHSVDLLLLRHTQAHFSSVSKHLESNPKHNNDGAETSRR